MRAAFSGPPLCLASVSIVLLAGCQPAATPVPAAAGSTVFLVLASRRATLRQINASLLEISEQLKQLRK